MKQLSTLPFGRTGHHSSRVIFGGAALSRVTQDVADRTLEILLEYGVNHIDVAASYGDAELRVQPWLRREPNRFFLATKTGRRRADEAREELHRSLDRLGVDHVDLWLIGVTGHGAQIAANHRRSLERFDFDSVLLPYNRPTMRLPYYAENFNALLDTCRQRQVAVQTIKAVARAPWLGRQRSAATWYEPFTEQADIDPAVSWALGEETVFLNSVGDVDILPRFLDAASRYQGRPSEAEMDALFERLQPQPIFV
ncbi:MAG: aldo/keto reductase [Catenulispora sp. 13_1_20CM_3_70_7]|nr:MAG: aldo/keto reductase [Catenulispora sp. 13_1_20CM_3_70_7]